MRQYERNDVIIDQCVECGGIFLDRGELERLSQAESNFYNPGNAAPLPPRERAPEPAPPQRYYDDERRYDDRPRDRRYDDYTRYDDRRSDRRSDDRRYDEKARRKRKRGSFFDEVFDLIGD